MKIASAWPSPVRCTMTPEASGSRGAMRASASAAVALHGKSALAYREI